MDILVQKDRRSARVLTTVSVFVVDCMDEGVDAVDEDGEGGPLSSGISNP